MKIMIALDGSAASDLPSRKHSSRPWPAHSEFHLITAIDPFFFVRSPMVLAEAKRATHQFLDRKCKKTK